MFINYAHRGASAYAPENTMRAFRLGVKMGANGIETDIRKTADGVLVLFHDESLLRLTGRDVRIGELTFDELTEIGIPSPDGTGSDTVPRLSTFLSFAKDQPVLIALEIKADGIEPEVLDAIRSFETAGKCIITSFEFDHIRNIKALAPAQKTGLLVRSVDDDVLCELKRIGTEQICPKADILSPELVRSLRKSGFNVRAWGVKDEALMLHALRCGVDGMTVNFPDKLHAILNKNV